MKIPILSNCNRQFHREIYFTFRLVRSIICFFSGCIDTIVRLLLRHMKPTHDGFSRWVWTLKQRCETLVRGYQAE